MRWLATVVAVGLLAACDINGNTTDYPGASVYEAPDKGFHFFFLAPPWRGAQPQPALLVHLAVSGPYQLPDSKDYTAFDLQVSYLKAATLLKGVQVLTSAAAKEGITVSKDAVLVASRSGEVGWELSGHKDEKNGRVFHRFSLFADLNGRVVLLHLRSYLSLAHRDLDDLVFSFTAGPAPEVDTPARVPDSAQADSLPALDAGGSGH